MAESLARDLGLQWDPTTREERAELELADAHQRLCVSAGD